MDLERAYDPKFGNSPWVVLWNPAVEPLAGGAAASPELITARMQLGGRVITYTRRFSARARWLRLELRSDTGLVVTAPQGSGEGQIERFLRRYGRWIVRRLDEDARVASRIPKRWPYGPSLPYRGDEHMILTQIVPGAPGVDLAPEHTLMVRLRKPTLAHARSVLKRWYVAEASRWLAAQARRFGDELGVRWTRLGVRDQRSRWGSCSPNGSLSFNYRLVMAPAPMLDYVVIHELAHCRELNHSRRFWTIVQTHCPGYRDVIRWLRTYGPYLGV